MPAIRLVLPLILLCPFSSFSWAEEVQTAPELHWRPQVWLTSGFWSHHFKRDAGFNERNTGIGAELKLDERKSVMIGQYYNSVRQTSRYLHMVYTPVNLGPVRFGFAAGALTGYPELNHGQVAPTLIPVATSSWRVLGQDVGANLAYIPTIAKRVDGALALQLKWRIN